MYINKNLTQIKTLKYQGLLLIIMNVKNKFYNKIFLIEKRRKV
jgi:hypothetical protein